MAPRAPALAVAMILASACGAAASPAATATAAPATAAATSVAQAVATSTTAGDIWTVTDASKATVSVREQLVGFSLPSDAVLVAKGAKGSFAIADDGTFTSGSTITFDLTTLTSDNGQRDGFVKQSVLQTRQFPTAGFVPVKATGLTLPLAASGEFAFTIGGRMTIRGVTQDVAFNVKASRSGGRLSATATADPVLTFEQFGMRPPTIPGRVLSVVDEIRLVVELVATANG